MAEVIIIGGGIVELVTALQIKQQRSRLRVTVLEKENRVAAHQTGLRSNWRLVYDFAIIESDRAIHVCNAPSPAAAS